MIAFPFMLVPMAEEAGIKVPPDIDDYNQANYPHFTVYVNFQAGRPMPSPTSHWDNAKIVSQIPESKIMTISFEELDALGAT